MSDRIRDLVQQVKSLERAGVIQLRDEDDEFCHIIDQAGKFYCGRKRTGPLTCDIYRGEAICPSCGRPTCPTCAVQSDLNARLEGAK